MESTNLWHLSAVIPLQDSFTTFQFIYISWCCFRHSIFDVTLQVLDWIKVRGLGWPLHNINFVGLEPRFCSFTSVFGLIVLLKHPFQGHVLFSIRQHDLFKYFDTCKLIHDPWYAINRPNTIVGETCISWCLHHHLHCLHCVLWLEFRVWGSSYELSAALGPKKNNFTLISPQNVPLFLFRPVDVYFGKL